MTQKEFINKLNRSTRAMNRRNEDRLHGTFQGHVVAVETSSVRMICNICHQLPKNSQEVLEINAFGYHMTCDHVLGDVQDQMKDSEMDFVKEDDNE